MAKLIFLIIIIGLTNCKELINESTKQIQLNTSNKSIESNEINKQFEPNLSTNKEIESNLITTNSIEPNETSKQFELNETNKQFEQNISVELIGQYENNLFGPYNYDISDSINFHNKFSRSFKFDAFDVPHYFFFQPKVLLSQFIYLEPPIENLVNLTKDDYSIIKYDESNFTSTLNYMLVFDRKKNTIYFLSSFDEYGQLRVNFKTDLSDATMSYFYETESRKPNETEFLKHRLRIYCRSFNETIKNILDNENSVIEFLNDTLDNNDNKMRLTFIEPLNEFEFKLEIGSQFNYSNKTFQLIEDLKLNYESSELNDKFYNRTHLILDRVFYSSLSDYLFDNLKQYEINYTIYINLTNNDDDDFSNNSNFKMHLNYLLIILSYLIVLKKLFNLFE